VVGWCCCGCRSRFCYCRRCRVVADTLWLFLFVVGVLIFVIIFVVVVIVFVVKLLLFCRGFRNGVVYGAKIRV